MGISSTYKSAKVFAKDLTERAGWTFVQGAAAVAITAATPVTGTEWKALAVAVVAGGLSAAKSMIFKSYGIKNSASSSKGV
jgi:hypothetical protein